MTSINGNGRRTAIVTPNDTLIGKDANPEHECLDVGNRVQPCALRRRRTYPQPPRGPSLVAVELSLRDGHRSGEAGCGPGELGHRPGLILEILELDVVIKTRLERDGR